MSGLTLYDYWRSSTAYRVRIALNLKSLPYESIPVNLLKGEQKSAAYKARNPLGSVPTLSSDKGDFVQSLAILEYLEEAYPTPKLLPDSLEARAKVRAIANLITSELHAVNNLRIRDYLKSPLHLSEAKQTEWVQHWLKAGLGALETMVRSTSSNGKFCYGSQPTMADICLVPQMYSSRRFMPELSAYPTLVAIDAHCRTLPAFDKAQPEKQIDAAA